VKSRSRLPKRAARFITREERLARKTKSAKPYFRLGDSLCKRFLELATYPAEFEGLKLLFPFVREMSLLQLKRSVDQLPTWMHLAFMAGHDLGRAHPDRLEEVLPFRELWEGRRRVGVVHQNSGEEHLTFTGLQHACARIVDAKWKDVSEDDFEDVLLEAVVNTLRTGFAAATVSRGDPVQCDFVSDLPERIGDGISDIQGRALVGAPLSAVGKTVAQLLEHPLLTLARELYPGKQLEGEVALRFLRGQLRAHGVKSEGECPASEMDLSDWIAAGVNYGRALKAESPAVVEKIFEGCKPDDLEGSLRVVREVVAKAGPTSTWRLTQVLKEWQQSAYGWVEPQFYGAELTRVVYFSDFAIWIPWVATEMQACPFHR